MQRPAAQASFRPWPLDDSIAHLVVLDVDMVPTRHDVATWISDAADELTPSIERVRTGAMFPDAAAAFIEAGFTVADRLALLERPLIANPTPRPSRTDVSITRLSARDLAEAAVIDQRAFPDGWQHDAASLDDIATATPQVRRRVARTRRRSGRDMVGFSISGKAGTVGYLQRIAVHPDQRRNGIASVLVDDALQWMMRRGASRCLVNTGVDNIGALRLYEQAGFTRRDDDLVVLELHRAA